MSAADTREMIRAAGARAFAERGYHGTCLRGVAREAGIQKASLFHHFPNKEALYRAVIQDGHGKTEAMIRGALAQGGGWWGRLEAVIDGYIGLVAAHPEQTRILLRRSLGDAPEPYDGHGEAERLVTMVTDFLAEGQRAGAFAPLDAASLVLGIVGMVLFFFTSAPVLSPRWDRAHSAGSDVAELRCQVATIVRRALTPDFAPPRAVRRAAIAPPPMPSDRHAARGA